MFVLSGTLGNFYFTTIGVSEISLLFGFLFIYFSSILVRGFPVWLRDIPGIQFRTDNEPFKVHFWFEYSFHIFFVIVLSKLCFSFVII